MNEGKVAIGEMHIHINMAVQRRESGRQLRMNVNNWLKQQLENQAFKLGIFQGGY
jgi:hypothetical protein